MLTIKHLGDASGPREVKSDGFAAGPGISRLREVHGPAQGDGVGDPLPLISHQKEREIEAESARGSLCGSRTVGRQEPREAAGLVPGTGEHLPSSQPSGCTRLSGCLCSGLSSVTLRPSDLP